MIHKITVTVIMLYTTAVLTSCVQPEETVSSLNGNRSPVIESILIEPVIINVGTTAKITVNAADPDGDPLIYSYSTALGDIIGSGAVVRYTAAFCCVGLNTITATVADSKGARVSKEIHIEILP